MKTSGFPKSDWTNRNVGPYRDITDAAYARWLEVFPSSESPITHQAIAFGVYASLAMRDDALQEELTARYIEELRDQVVNAVDNYITASNRALAAEDERDALQGRLDAMTVEWGTGYWAGSQFGQLVFNSEADAREDARESGDPLVNRLVGPWTVVPEGEQP